MHFSRSDKSTAITDAVSRRHGADKRDSGLPRHYWMQDALKFWQRRNAVDQHAGSHDFERLLGEGKHTRSLQHMRLVITGNLGAQLSD